MNSVLPVPEPEPSIVSIRGKVVVLDSELAKLYRVPTKLFNRAVKRNARRFPPDFAFRLNLDEFRHLRCQNGTSNGRGGRRHPPWVFTEHGAIMAAMLLNSDRAVAMSLYVVRAFVKMREALLARTEIEKRLAEIERTLVEHDSNLKDLYDKLRPLLLPPPEEPSREIGFHVKPE